MQRPLLHILPGVFVALLSSPFGFGRPAGAMTEFEGAYPKMQSGTPLHLHNAKLAMFAVQRRIAVCAKVTVLCDP